jgi:hypothetical protein
MGKYGGRRTRLRRGEKQDMQHDEESGRRKGRKGGGGGEGEGLNGEQK